MTLLLAFLGRAWPYLLAIALAAALWWKADHYCNSVCRDARGERDSLRAEKVAAQERATALALLWSAQLDKTDAEVRKREAEKRVQFSGLMDRAQSLDRGAGLRIGNDTARLLLDASRAANSGTTAEHQEEPAPVPEPAEEHTYSTFNDRDLAEAWIKAAAAYADAVMLHRACVEAWDQLRGAHVFQP